MTQIIRWVRGTARHIFERFGHQRRPHPQRLCSRRLRGNSSLPQPNERETSQFRFRHRRHSSSSRTATSMMLRQLYRRTAPTPPSSAILLIATILFIGVINCVTSRSIDPVNLSVDKSEVPARYVFEIDEVQEELSEINKRRPTNQGYSDSGLMFDMPIAVAIFSAVMLLVCCFCCLRCAVTYDGIKRAGSYGNSKKTSVDVVRRLKANEPINK